MKKTRIFSLIALVLAMLMVFAACAPAATDTKSNDSEQTTPADTQQTEEPAKTDDAAAQTPAEPVTITYCNFNSSGGNEETLQKMVEAFEATHENIKIEVETIGYDDYFTQMQTRVAGGTAPDCYELNIENFAAYANKGLLAEITGQDLSGLNETALGAFNVNGKQYGLPESFSNVVLIYNKDLFDQAGVTYPTDDWTQDDVQNAAEKIRALGDDIFGIWQPITSLFAANKGKDFYKLTDDTLKTVGPILFVTAAGGVLGKVIASSDMVNFIKANAEIFESIGIFFPFLLAAILKSAQGSSTVAITTTAGIVAPLLPVLGLDSPALSCLTVIAIGAGAMTVSHANDSYFWVVTNFGEMTPQDGYKTQTLGTLVIGVVSIIGVFIVSLFLH